MKKNNILCACVLVLALTAGCGSTSKNIEVPELLEPVEAASDMATVTRSDICNVSLHEAQVIPYTEEVGFEIEGTIADIKVRLGDEVNKGDVLATLDGGENNTEYLDIVTSINDAKQNNSESNLLAEYDIKIMEAEKNVLKKQLKKATSEEKDKIKNDMAIKEADIKIARQELEDAKVLQKLQLEELKRKKKIAEDRKKDYYLYSPISGTVACISASVGDAVNADAFVMAIADNNRKRVKAEFVSSMVLNKADRYYAKYGKQEYGVKQLEYDAAEIDEIIANEGTPYAYYELTESNTDFEIGDYLDFYVESGYVENALTIPVNALYKESSLRYVYKNVDGKKVKTEVTVGTITSTSVQITDGLQEGDMVYVQQ